MSNSNPITLSNPLKLSVITLSVALLSACGSGSSGGSSNSNKEVSVNSPVTGDSTTELVEKADQVELTEKDGTQVITDVITTPVVTEKQDTTQVVNPANPTNADVFELASSDLSVYNRLNTRRTSCGFGSLGADEELKKAADNHANYLRYASKNSSNSFEGHNETDKANPFYTGLGVAERVQTGDIKNQAQAVNYDYRALTENLSFLRYNQAYYDATNDTDIALNSIKGLLAAPYHMATLLSPNYTEVGISYVRDRVKAPIQSSDSTFGSVLEIVMGTPRGTSLSKVDGVVSYPCDGIEDTQFELRHESPNPFKGTSRNLATNPIGQPIYIYANDDIKVTNAVMKDAANQSVKLLQLNSTNDPNDRLQANQVILMPDVALKPAQMYTMTYNVSVNGGVAQLKKLTFKTKAK